VLTSLALHALLLYALPLLKDAQRRLPVKLTARLAKPPESAPQKVEAQPQQPQLQPRPATPRPAPAPKAEPQPASVVAPVISVAPAKQAPEPAFTVFAPPVVPVPVSPQAPPARTEPQAALQASGGPDAGTVAQFRLELMDLARRYKKYPRVAQDNNWEGRVELRIAIGEDGAISSLTVKKGAGRTVLDEEAQSMIRVAKSKATIPPALRGKAFVLEIPVDFSLKD
jgi:TonB family protein